MRRAAKCECCKAEEAIYALQFVASDDPTFSTLGSHVRGFPVVAKVGDKCAELIRDGVIAILPA